VTPAPDVSKLPGAQSFTPNIAPYIESLIATDMANLAIANKQAADHYGFLCTSWAHDATNARAVGQPLPSKPVAPLSQVIVTSRALDGTTWIATTDGPPVGPPCPDLPAQVVPAPPSFGGLTPVPQDPLTQDQKLDAIAAMVKDARDGVNAIRAALKI
jgi:hypothetical protein